MAALAEKRSVAVEAGLDAATICDAIHTRFRPQADTDPFTAHVFACIIAVGVAEARTSGVSVGNSLGLDRDTLAALIRAWTPTASSYVDMRDQPEHIALDEEEDQLRALFERYRADDSAETDWLVAIMTRRSMSPRHLWQDLGLFSRDELGRLISQRFPNLARRNTQNMKWKKFFYRSLCELEGFSLCSAPTCRECGDYSDCFGAETGESLLAGSKSRRSGHLLDLARASLSTAD